VSTDPRLRPAASGPPVSGSLLVALAQAFPHLSADAIVNLHKWASASSPPRGRDSRHPRMTTASPTRWQVLFMVDDATMRVDFERCTHTLNNFLSSQKVSLRVESTTCAYGGWSLSTNMSPSPAQVDLIQTGLTEHYWSKPSFKVEAYILASKSYLKLVDVPRFSSGRIPTTGEAIKEVMQLSAHCSRFLLASNVQVVTNSRQVDTSTAFFEVWDSRSGSLAWSLIRRTVQFGRWSLCIVETRAMPGVPVCQRCWRWGHPTALCKAKSAVCSMCKEPHHTEHHCEMASCCWGNAKANPPIVPTPQGEPCPHSKRCPNCGEAHVASDRKCIFWKHRFDHEWIQLKYSEVCSCQSVRLTPPANSISHA
jgi:hypothetical protein